MKKLLALMLFIYHTSFATTYYVSNAGNDANDGLTPATSWETLAKVNATATSGDTVKFKCNDTWSVTNRLIPASSNVYYTSYSTGSKPLITGLGTASMASLGSNIYSTTIPTGLSLNTVVINGVIGWKARNNNTNYTTNSGSSGDSSITTLLSGTPNYTGTEIVIRTSNWVIDKSVITSQSGAVLNFSPKTTYNVGGFGGNGYFLQNNESFLDVQGEWSYNATTGVLKVYATSTPTVQYSTVDTLVWVKSKSNITINGIAFIGANVTAFQLDTCSNITITNCSINNCGTNGITGGKSHHITIRNDSLQNCMNGSIYMRNFVANTPMIDTCNNLTVYNNYIHNVGIYAGMGLSGNGRYNAINIVGDSSIIEGNLIDSVGYMPIQFNGRGAIIKHNYINQFCYIKCDGGGIYSVVGSYIPESYNAGAIIRGNIIRNGIGNSQGTNQDSANHPYAAAGIYYDDNNNNAIIDSNTVENTKYAGFNLNTGYNITLKYNTIVSSTGTVVLTGGNASSYGLNYKNNIYYQKNTYYYTVRQSSSNGLSSDSNYFLRPLLPTGLISVNGVGYSLPQYQANTSLDLHSSIISNITDSVGILYTNPSNNPITVMLPDTNNYRDVYGNIYLDIAVIPAWSSRLLFKSMTILTKSTNYLRF